MDHFDLKNSSAPRLGIKGSWRSESLADTPRIGFGSRSAIEPLVAAEFENLVNLTDTLKTREVRGLAQLEIARFYLEKEKTELTPNRAKITPKAFANFSPGFERSENPGLVV